MRSTGDGELHISSSGISCNKHYEKLFTHVPLIKFNCPGRKETTCDVTMVSTVNFLVVRYSAVRDFVESAHVAQVAKRANLSAS